MSKTNQEALRELAGVGLSIGAIMAETAIRETTRAAAVLGMFAGKQAVRVLRPAAEMFTSQDLMDRRGYVRQPTKTVIENFVGTLMSEPDNVTKLDEHIEVVADSLSSIHDVADGIRLHDGPEGVIGMSFIATEFVVQVASMTEESGIDPAVANRWQSTLQSRSQIEPERQSWMQEQTALDRIVARTRLSDSVTL